MNNFKFLRKLKFSNVNYSNISVVSVEQWRIANDNFNRKIKGTFFEKWFNYWKQIGRDYADVAASLKQEARAKPMKTITYFIGFGFLGCCMKLNPNLQSFRAKYIQCANDMTLVSSAIANPDSVNHLKYIEKCFNANLIRYMNLGICSLVWVDEYSSECDTYECKCQYLQVPYRRFIERILDVGFMNVWWITSRKMLDYDINY